jgi:hypothetical protein
MDDVNEKQCAPGDPFRLRDEGLLSCWDMEVRSS